MKRNDSFGKLVQGGLESAPEAFVKDGVMYLHPTAEDYALAGYLHVSRERPSEPAPEGKHWTQDGWQELDGTIRPVWVAQDDPPTPVPAPRVFSKLKVVQALIGAEKWDQAKQLIENAGMYDLFLAAQVFKEDDVNFESGLAELKRELEMSDEQVEAILSACVAEV